LHSYYSGLISGDDSITKLRQKDLEDFPNLPELFDQHCYRMGFEAESSLPDGPWDAKFCSKLFWPVKAPPEQATILLGPLPGRLLGKIAWTLKHPKEGNFRGTLIALSRDAAHIPFVRVYVRRCLKLSSGQKAKFSSHHAYGNQAVRAHAADEDRTWMFVAARYGLTLADEVEFAEALELVTVIPHVFTNRVMDRLIEVDSTKCSTVDIGGMY